MVFHDYTCVSCSETREYEHRMSGNPRKCSNCHSTYGLIKQISAPHVATSNKSDSDSSAPSDSKYIDVGIIQDPETGESTLAGTTKEIRRDGTPFFEANVVELGTGKNLGMETLIDLDKL